jgi:hypothetical protein
MTQDEIYEMAIQAELNLYVHDLTEKRYIEVIEAFAKLATAKEREACAKVAESNFGVIGSTIAIAIRARGEA